MPHHQTFTTLTRPLVLRPRPTARLRLTATLAVVVGVTLAVVGCASQPPLTGTDHPEQPLSHVHGIVADPAGDGFLIGTHEGIFPVTSSGELGPRIAGADFDAMGLTVVDDTLLASGHPGRSTPAELGAPNLGIVRSIDRAETWEPVAFTGEKDFHALTAGPDGTVYGLATGSAEIQTSTDYGETWTPTGASLLALGFTVDADGRVVASTPDGPQVSTDRGASFSPWPGAPLLAALNASPDHQRLVGIGSGGTIWTTTTGATQWTEVGAVHDTAQAVAITNEGDMLVVDDSGITTVPNS